SMVDNSNSCSSSRLVRRLENGYPQTLTGKRWSWAYISTGTASHNLPRHRPEVDQPHRLDPLRLDAVDLADTLRLLLQLVLQRLPPTLPVPPGGIELPHLSLVEQPRLEVPRLLLGDHDGLALFLQDGAHVLCLLVAALRQQLLGLGSQLLTAALQVVQQLADVLRRGGLGLLQGLARDRRPTLRQQRLLQQIERLSFRLARVGLQRAIARLGGKVPTGSDVDELLMQTSCPRPVQAKPPQENDAAVRIGR